jgi:hypothetical protein
MILLTHTDLLALRAATVAAGLVASRSALLFAFALGACASPGAPAPAQVSAAAAVVTDDYFVGIWTVSIESYERAASSTEVVAFDSGHQLRRGTRNAASASSDREPDRYEWCGNTIAENAAPMWQHDASGRAIVFRVNERREFIDAFVDERMDGRQPYVIEGKDRWKTELDASPRSFLYFVRRP